METIWKKVFIDLQKEGQNKKRQHVVRRKSSNFGWHMRRKGKGTTSSTKIRTQKRKKDKLPSKSHRFVKDGSYYLLMNPNI